MHWEVESSDEDEPTRCGARLIPDYDISTPQIERVVSALANQDDNENCKSFHDMRTGKCTTVFSSAGDEDKSKAQES